MGRKKQGGNTPQVNFRLRPDDKAHMELIAKRLADAVDDVVDNTRAVRHALRVAARSGVSVLGELGAGKAKWTRYAKADSLPITETFGDDVVAYRVRGVSMVDYHIIEGDHVLVRPQPVGLHGQIVVAWVQGKGGIIKRYNEPKHALYSGIGRDRWNYDLKEGDEILGVYVGLVRQAVVHGQT